MSRVFHIYRSMLLGLGLLGRSQALTRVAHLLHGGARAGEEQEAQACNRKQTQGAGRDV